jgi:hypothetical protein
MAASSGASRSCQQLRHDIGGGPRAGAVDVAVDIDRHLDRLMAEMPRNAQVWRRSCGVGAGSSSAPGDGFVPDAAPESGGADRAAGAVDEQPFLGSRTVGCAAAETVSR